MQRKLTSFIGVCLLVSMIACSKPEEIKGQVFIATGIGSFKLGAVDVKVFSEEEFKNHVEERKKRILPEKKRLQDEFDSTKADFDKSTTETNEAIAKVDQFVQTHDLGAIVRAGVRAENGESQSDPNEGKLIAQYHQYDELTNVVINKKNENLTKKEAYLKAQTALEAWRPEPIYFVELPKPLASSTTDADGNFQLSLPSGKYVIVATSQREAAGETESYYWAVKLEVPRQATGPVILSNSNLTSARSPEGFGMPQ